MMPARDTCRLWLTLSASFLRLSVVLNSNTVNGFEELDGLNAQRSGIVGHFHGIKCVMPVLYLTDERPLYVHVSGDLFLVEALSMTKLCQTLA